MPRTSDGGAIDVGDVRSQFIADLDAGRVPTVVGCSDQARWWARSLRLQDGGLVLIVDDGDGQLLRLPVTAAHDGLSYGQPQLVSRPFVAVAASASGAAQVLATWSAHTTTLTASHTKEPTMKISDTLTVPNSKLIQLFDLPSWADETTIRAAMQCAPSQAEIKAAARPPAPAARPSTTTPAPAQRSLADAAAQVRAASNAELLARGDALAAEELSHRQFEATHFPGAFGPRPTRRTRIHHYS